MYAPTKLWLAYGIALLCTSIAVGIGSISILSEKASYSNKFSAVYRASQAATINVDSEDGDLNAADALPKYLAEARVRLCEGVPATSDEAVQSKDSTFESELMAPSHSDHSLD